VIFNLNIEEQGINRLRLYALNNKLNFYSIAVILTVCGDYFSANYPNIILDFIDPVIEFVICRI